MNNYLIGKTIGTIAQVTGIYEIAKGTQRDSLESTLFYVGTGAGLYTLGKLCGWVQERIYQKEKER